MRTCSNKDCKAYKMEDGKKYKYRTLKYSCAFCQADMREVQEVEE